MTDFSPAARRSALWSTDAAAALGLSKYKTPVQLWLEKVGRSDGEDVSEKFAVRLGLVMQPVLAAMHVEDTGDKLTPLSDVEHRITTYDTPLAAHYDEFNATRNALHEIKCFGDSRRKDFGEPSTDEVPMEILSQVIHQQGVWLASGGASITGTEVNVSFGNRERAVFFVPLDLEAVNRLFATLADFWKMVRSEISPPARSEADALALFPRSMNGKQVNATPEVEEACRRLSRVKELVGALETEETDLKAAIKAHMADADFLIGSEGKPLATWRTAAGAVKIDTTKLREQEPEIARRFSIEGAPSRRFLLKKG